MVHRSIVLMLIILYLIIMSIAISYAQTNYRLKSSSFSSGSGQHASSNYRLRGDLPGVISPCQSQSTNFKMQPDAVIDCSDTIPVIATPTAPPISSPTSTMPTPTATFTVTLTATHTPSPTSTSPTSTATFTVTPTVVFPTPPGNMGDDYEADDSCQNARPIPTDGKIQTHTFHHLSDADWVQFEAQVGETYLIEGRVPSPSEVDLVVELYNSCTGGAQQAQNYAFSADIRIQFTVTTNSTIYLHLLNDESEKDGNEQSYHLSVRTLSASSLPGALIIIAGRIRNSDSLQSNIDLLANRAWRLWHSHDYPAERIRYLATDLTIDANGDGTGDVYALPSRANFRAAIIEWAKEKVSVDRPLTIYLVDHGDPDLFYLDKPRSELLHPQELDEWLDTLEAAIPGLKITVIIEACYSGSFIQKANTISGANRVIITSTDADTPSWASKQGAYFSDSFFDTLSQGQTLYAAFQEGEGAAHRVNPNQQAWLDDNGDGVMNKNDGEVATQRSLIRTGTLDAEKWPPYVPHVELRNVGNDRYEIWAQALDDEVIQAVWAEVYPPSYQPPTSSDELVAGPVPISLQSRGEHLFAALYGQLEEIGEYRVVIYAEDILGLRSRPREIRMETGQRVYLPLVIR